MKFTDTLPVVYCVRRDTGSRLTFGKSYPVLAADPEKRQLRVAPETGKRGWYHWSCFDIGPPVTISALTIDDPLDLDRVEVTLTLSDCSRRWCGFSTPQGLTNILTNSGDPAISNKHMIVVSTITADTITKVLRHYEEDGSLLEVTIPLNDDDDLYTRDWARLWDHLLQYRE